MPVTDTGVTALTIVQARSCLCAAPHPPSGHLLPAKNGEKEGGKSGAPGRVSAFGSKGLRNRKVQQFTQFISGAGFCIKQG